MSKTYKIGIPVWEVAPNVLGATKNYISFIKKFGECILLDPEHELRTDLDMIVLPGGADVDTKRYNQAPGPYTGKPDIYKEWFDFEYLPKYLGLKIPIFGICRGMQSLWVEFGGKLHQDLAYNCDIYYHPTNDQKDPFSPMHLATVETNIMLALNDKNCKESFLVNSRHHQVVNEDTKPNCLHVFSRHSDKNSSDITVEGFVHKTLPVVGVQHHPEDCPSVLTTNIMKALLKYKKPLYKK